MKFFVITKNINKCAKSLILILKQLFLQFIVLAALVAIAAAAPQHYHDNTYVVRETPHNNIGIGGYNYGYELSNGESRQEFAEMRNAGSENAFLVVRGSYTMVDPATGQQYVINYVADENGFHPEGDHLPI